MESLKELFDKNRAWAEEITRQDPGFFARLAAQQAPQYLWIGCSDSRVPANQIVGLMPGEMFVHRNVANVVVHSDLNCLSVIQFAIDVLKVRHILVVGHSGCGGVTAALADRRIGIADNWIRHVQDVRNRHQAFLDGVAAERRVDALCELNVIEQAHHVCQTTVVQDAWSRGQQLAVHGWCYGLHDGLLQDLSMTVADPAQAGAAYERAIAAVHSRYGVAAPAA
jgi:carbonic anhydrase